MIKLIGLVPLLPLVGFLINGFFGKKMSKMLSGTIGTASVLGSFAIASPYPNSLYICANSSGETLELKRIEVLN